MTNSNMKTHLAKDHPEIILTVQDAASTQNASSSGVPRKKAAGYVNIFNLRTNEERNAMFQTTIPGWIESRNPLDFHSFKAQRIHKAIFEQMVVDLVPFHEVNKPGFLRTFYVTTPNFKVASDKYYRSLLDPTYDQIRFEFHYFYQTQTLS